MPAHASSYMCLGERDSTVRLSTMSKTISVPLTYRLRHFKVASLSYFLYHSSNPRIAQFSPERYDLVITTYETLGMHWKSGMTQHLCAHPWLRVILDEGKLATLFVGFVGLRILNLSVAHLIRDRSSIRHRAVCDLNARYRWCLTGTPIQNRIDDFGALLAFLRVVPFSLKNAFEHHIANPVLSQSQRGTDKLKTLIQAISLRRTKEAELQHLNLSCREKTIQIVTFNPHERREYEIVKRRGSLIAHSGIFEASGIAESDEGVLLDEGATNTTFVTITRLRQICNSRLLLPPTILKMLNNYFDSDLIEEKAVEVSSCAFDIGETIEDEDENCLEAGIPNPSHPHPMADLDLGTQLPSSCFIAQDSANIPTTNNAHHVADLLPNLVEEAQRSSKLRILMENLRQRVDEKQCELDQESPHMCLLTIPR